MHPFFLIILSVCIGTTSQLLLKAGMVRMGPVHLSVEKLFPLILQLALNPYIVGGTIGYALGMVVWLAVLSRMEVSVAYPMVSMGYAITAVAGYYFFGENLTPLRIFGIAVIMLGVFLVSRSA